MKIAIQGGKASFHDLAVKIYYHDTTTELVECRTFRQLCIAIKDGEADAAVMAVENTLAGSILPNYALLEEYPVTITGEIYLHIRQNLMALPGQKLTNIASVRSHPMALMQCSNFLEDHPQLKSIETFDTAESAREIREKNWPGVAAIASDLAAKMYGLEILAADIENLKQNYTRFLILQAGEQPRINGNKYNKASLNFLLRHEPGALVNFLQIFQKNSINLSLIQSIPIPGRPREYAFHMDMLWEDAGLFERSISEAKDCAGQMKILGIYNSGKLPYED